jgi:hypothetical protein
LNKKDSERGSIWQSRNKLFSLFFLSLAELLIRQANRRQRAASEAKPNRSERNSHSERGEPFLNKKDSERGSIWQSRSNLFSLFFLSLVIVVIPHIHGPFKNSAIKISNGKTVATSYLSLPPAKRKASTSPSHTSGKSFFLPRRITVSHVAGAGAGIGYGTNYSTLEVLFASLYHPDSFVPMIDLRGHRFDNDTFAANVGLIVRYVPDGGTFCQMLGFNVYYDYREGRRGSYNQVGAGIECLGKRLDFRGNVYCPVSKTSHKLVCTFDKYIGDFFYINRNEEAVTYGFNAEVGYLIVNSKQFLFYSAIGPYFLSKKWDRQTIGGKFRLQPQYKDYIALDLEMSYDPLFKWVYQTKIIVTLPLYQIPCRKNKAPCGITNRQIYQPVERFEVIPLRIRSCFQSNF